MPTNPPKSALLSLQDRVARVYYTHGLFCSTHPIPVIGIALTIILLSCYPFVHLPLPGYVPLEHVTSCQSYVAPPERVDVPSPLVPGGYKEGPAGGDGQLQPTWYHGLPVGYVQQILVRSSVSPWGDDLLALDAFRAPISKAFDIVEIMQNYEYIDQNRSVTLGDTCLHIYEAKVKKNKINLPAYGCLVVSPANVWEQDMQKFLNDPDLIKSINALGRKTTDPSPALNDILFGVPWKETAIKNTVHLSRQRTLSYAITFILRDYDLDFIQGLEKRLHLSFPFLQNNSVVGGNMTHVYFQGQYSLVEFVPLIVTYVILFLYIYFSVRKIEMVKSKVGMAFSAVITVVASLCMSVGLCTWFGLSFTIKAGQVYLKDIFPYLVVIIGLENILVLTKSVVSTPVNLDVKVRLAQGLSREGWSITKNLVTELSILTFGFFTFVPAIQEFCLFAVVGLLSDFFLQLVFFATILAIDIGRMEMSDLQKQSLHQRNEPIEEELTHMYPLLRWSLISRMHRQELKSARLASDGPGTSLFDRNEDLINPVYPTSVIPPGKVTLGGKVPKRLRLVYFLARRRIFQRAFMIIFICWVSFIGYKSGLVELFTFENSTLSTNSSNNTPTVNVSVQLPSMNVRPPVSGATTSPSPTTMRPPSTSISGDESRKTQSPIDGVKTSVSDDVANNLKHRKYELWRYLLKNHFPSLFGYYNISLNARYITILPPIKLSIPIKAETAIQMRHPSSLDLASTEVQSFRKWPTSSFMEKDVDEGLGDTPPSTAGQAYHQAYYPSSPAEVVLAVILAIPSLAFLVYVTIVLYQCICSRNYAEWRSSWSAGGRHSGEAESGSAADIFTQLVIEAMPVVLEGHPQEVECMATDGHLVVSSCLAGEIRVWDSTSGECLNVVDRKRRRTLKQNYRSARGLQLNRNHSHPDMVDDAFPQDAEAGSPSHASGSPKSHSAYGDLDEWPTVIGLPIRQYGGGAAALVGGRHVVHGLVRNHSTEDFSRSTDGVKMRRPDLFKRQPNLAPTIETNFTAVTSAMNVPISFAKTVLQGCLSPLSSSLPSMNLPQAASLDVNGHGFDFGGRFQIYYDEHRQLLDEETEEECGTRKSSDDLSPSPSQSPAQSGLVSRATPPLPGTIRTAAVVSNEAEDPATPTSSVWCVDCSENVIVAGCSDGTIEFWNTLSGVLMYIHEDASHQGITGIRLCGSRIIAVRISGTIDFLELSFTPTAVLSGITSSSPPPSSTAASMHRRMHINPVTILSPEKLDEIPWAWEQDNESVTCLWLRTLKAHQQPITVLEVEGGKAVTGSQDHTLKVFKVDDATCQVALHGHYGPISTLFIDKLSPMTAASGSQDGAVCLWDLQTGTCVCRLRGHDGAVTALSYTASYVLSAGTDNRLLVWERFQGHLLNTIYLKQSYCGSIIMLTDNLLLTGRQGSLGVWDIRLGDPVRIVKLGNNDDSVLVRQIRHVGHTIVCDYGNQLRVVRFPAIVEKLD